METIMELDDLKSAWQSLDRQLKLQNSIRIDERREHRLGKARGSLRPLFWGQVAQILLFGIPFILLAALLWSTGPVHASTIVAGVVVHAYGIVAIISAGVVLGQMRRINYAAPVIEIQKQLVRVRTFYVRSGMLAGLPWWFLWVPVLMVLAGLGDVELMARAPMMVWSGLLGGAVGLLATLGFHHWARLPGREGLAAKLEDSLTGASLRKARRQLEEIERFAQD